MTLVLTESFNEVTWEYELLCSSCKKPMGRVSRQEMSWLAAGPEQPLCFECDGFLSDLIPPHLTTSTDAQIAIYHTETGLYCIYDIKVDGTEPFWEATPSTRLSLSSCPYLPQEEQKNTKAGDENEE